MKYVLIYLDIPIGFPKSNTRKIEQVIEKQIKNVHGLLSQHVYSLDEKLIYFHQLVSFVCNLVIQQSALRRQIISFQYIIGIWVAFVFTTDINNVKLSDSKTTIILIFLVIHKSEIQLEFSMRQVLIPLVSNGLLTHGEIDCK